MKLFWALCSALSAAGAAGVYAAGHEPFWLGWAVFFGLFSIIQVLDT